MIPSSNKLLEKNVNTGSGTSKENATETGAKRTKKSAIELLEEQSNTGPDSVKKKDEELPPPSTGLEPAFPSTGATEALPSPSTTSPLQWFAPMKAPQEDKPESFSWDNVFFHAPISQPPGLKENKAAEISKPQSDAAPLSLKKLDATSFIESDIERYGNVGNVPGASIPLPIDPNSLKEGQSSPFGYEKYNAQLPATLKPVVVKSIVDGKGNEVVDYLDARRGQISNEIADIDRKINEINERSTVQLPDYISTTYSPEDNKMIGQLATKRKELSDYMKQLQQSAEQVAIHNINKKYDPKTNKYKDYQVFNMGNAIEDGMILTRIKDPVAYERMQKTLKATSGLTEFDQYRLASEGFNAHMTVKAEQIEHQLELVRPKLDKIDQEEKAITELRSKIDSESDAKTKNELIGLYNEKLNSFNSLVRDPDVRNIGRDFRYFDSLSKEAIKLSDKFPEVRREELTQALTNAFYERVKQKRNISTTSPLTNWYSIASLIFNEEPEQEDYEALSKQFTENGVPLTPDEIKKLAEYDTDGFKTNNLRVDGLLSSFSQSIMRTFGDLSRSANSWEWFRNAVNMDESEAENMNAYIDYKEKQYSRRADQDKIIKSGQYVNTTPGSEMFSRTDEVKKEAGELNLTPGAVTNLIGDGLAQLVVFGTAGRMAGGAARSMASAFLTEDAAAMAGIDASIGVGLEPIADVGIQTEKIAGYINKAQRFGELAATAGTFYATAYGRHYDEAKKYSNDPETIRASAIANSTIDAASTLILPQVDIMRALSGERANLFKAFDNLFKAQGKKITPALMKEYAGVVMSRLNMPTRVGVESVIRAVGEPIADSEILNKKIDWNELRQSAKTAFVTGFISTLPLAPFVGGGMRNRSDLMEHAMYDAGVNPNRYRSYINDLVEKGAMEKDAAKQRIAFINTMEQIVSRFPKTDPDGRPYSQEQMRKWAVEDFRAIYDKFHAKRTQNQAMREEFEKDAEEATQIQRKLLEQGGKKQEERQQQAKDQIVEKAKEIKEKIEGKPEDKRTDKDQEALDAANQIISSILPTETETPSTEADSEITKALKGEEESKTADATTLPKYKSREQVEQAFKEQTGDNIGVAKTKLAGIEVRNLQRESKNLDGEPEKNPYTDEQMQLIKLWEAFEKKSPYLFHSTKPENIDSIKSEGLVSGKNPRHPGVSSQSKISLSANEELARHYGSSSDVMLRVKKDFKIEDIEDDLLTGGGAYLTPSNIPASALEIKTSKGWVPLEEYQSDKKTQTPTNTQKLTPEESSIVEAISNEMKGKTGPVAASLSKMAKDPNKHRELINELIDQSSDEPTLRKNVGDAITDQILSLKKPKAKTPKSTLNDQKVSEINRSFEDEYYAIEDKKQPLVDKYQDEVAKLKGLKGDARERQKKIVDNINSEIQSLESESLAITNKWTEQISDYVKQRVTEDGLELNSSQIESITGEVFDSVFERTGREANWNNKLSDIVNDILSDYKEEEPSEESSDAASKKPEKIKTYRKRNKNNISKDSITYQVSQLDLVTPFEKALGHFATGGKINPSAINELFGNKKKSVEGQRKALFGLTSNEAPGINDLAHQLWESDESGMYSSEDFRDAIEQALISYQSAGEMGRYLLDTYVIEEVKGQLTEQEFEQLNDQFIKKVADLVESLPETVKNELQNLLSNYQTATLGEIDWKQLQADSDGFNIDILNLSDAASKALNELLSNFKYGEDGKIVTEEKSDKQTELISKAEEKVKAAEKKYEVAKKKLTEAENKVAGTQSQQLSFDQPVQAGLFGGMERPEVIETLSPLRENAKKAKAELDAANSELSNLQNKQDASLFSEQSEFESLLQSSSARIDPQDNNILDYIDLLKDKPAIIGFELPNGMYAVVSIGSAIAINSSVSTTYDGPLGLMTYHLLTKQQFDDIETDGQSNVAEFDKKGELLFEVNPKVQSKRSTAIWGTPSKAKAEKITKQLAGKEYNGKIIEDVLWSSGDKFYTIKYEDGTAEQMVPGEVDHYIQASTYPEAEKADFSQAVIINELDKQNQAEGLKGWWVIEKTDEGLVTPSKEYADKLQMNLHGRFDTKTKKTISQIKNTLDGESYTVEYVDGETVKLKPTEILDFINNTREIKSINGHPSNFSGVFTKENPDAKTESLYSSKKGYKGVPVASLSYIQLDTGKWVATLQYSTSIRGSSSPLSAGWKEYDSKEQALSETAKEMVFAISKHTPETQDEKKTFDKITEWANNYILDSNYENIGTIPTADYQVPSAITEALVENGQTPEDILQSDEAAEWYDKHKEEIESLPPNVGIPSTLFSDFEPPAPKQEANQRPEILAPNIDLDPASDKIKSANDFRYLSPYEIIALEVYRGYKPQYRKDNIARSLSPNGPFDKKAIKRAEKIIENLKSYGFLSSRNSLTGDGMLALTKAKEFYGITARSQLLSYDYNQKNWVNKILNIPNYEEGTEPGIPGQDGGEARIDTNGQQPIKTEKDGDIQQPVEVSIPKNERKSENIAASKSFAEIKETIAEIKPYIPMPTFEALDKVSADIQNEIIKSTADEVEPSKEAMQMIYDVQDSIRGVKKLAERKARELSEIEKQILEIQQRLAELEDNDESDLPTVSETDYEKENEIAALKRQLQALLQKQKEVEEKYNSLINQTLSDVTGNINRGNGNSTGKLSKGRIPGTVSGDAEEQYPQIIPSTEGTDSDQPDGSLNEKRDEAIRGKRDGMGRTYGTTIGASSNEQEIKALGGVVGDMPELQKGKGVIKPAMNGNNFVIPPNIENQQTFGVAKKYDDNIAALRTLATLLSENRPATPSEKETLFKYVGFGGLKDILVDPNYSYGWTESTSRFKPKVKEVYDIVSELENLGLTDALNNIKASTDTAFFTPFAVIRTIYQGIEQLGFDGGKVLDPSAGIGHFFGMMPNTITDKSELHGIELDKITGNILKILYPDANISVSGLQEANTIPNYYDLIISNIPFGNTKVYDRDFNKSKVPALVKSQGKVHNYFFAKAITNARPGGLIAFVTSTGVLDSPDNEYIRKYITDNAEVLGVFRLPDSTFKANANTEAVSDVIFLRKYVPGETVKPSPISELYSVNVPHKSNGFTYDVELNRYFENNPENLLGEIKAGGQYREDDFTVLPKQGQNLENALLDRIKVVLPKNIYTGPQSNATNPDAIKKYYVEHATNLKEGNLTISDGKILVVQASGSTENAIEASIPKQHKPKVEKFIRLRDAMNKLFAAEVSGESETNLAPLRKKLNEAYDDFVKKFGYLSDAKNSTLYSIDVDGYNVRGLEKYENNKPVKADIFTKRVFIPYQKPEKAETIDDAILISLNEYGRINMPRLEELLSKTQDEILEEAKGLIFENPTGGFETDNEYLSGNVRQKLIEAEKAAKVSSRFNANVEALRNVVPADIPASEIDARIGARWIMKTLDPNQPESTKVFEDFAEDLFQAPVKIIYMPSSDSFKVEIRGYSPIAAQKYKVKNKSAEDILEDALHSTPPIIWDTIEGPDGKPKRVKNEELTKKAVDKFYEIRNAFADWIWKDEGRRTTLARIYNDTFNTNVKRNFDGAHLSLPGYAGPTPYNYQKAGVWMIVQNNGGIIDHIVGAGKTLVMVISAMELKRNNIAKKPMLICLKANVAQVAKAFRDAYPLAKVLAPKETDFQAKNRKALLSQIALNDWDAVIITHDNYVSIPHDPEIERNTINDELSHLDMDIERMRAEKGSVSKQQLKGLETRKKNLLARLQDLADVKKDKELRTFEELGVDHIMVDESHYFKNLSYSTKLSNVAGMGKADGAKKTFQLLTGIRYLQQLHRGDKGVTFLSGTPISNSIIEMYLLLKYLRPRKLEEINMTTLDSWAANFAYNYLDVEYSVTGSLQTKDRFREFVNLPELSMLYNEIADVRNDMNIDPPIDKPKMKLVPVEVEPSEAQKAFFKGLDQWASLMKAKKESDADKIAYKIGLGTLSEGQKKSFMLLATGMGTKAAIDMRMIFPNAISDGGKIPVIANNVYNEWVKSKSYSGAQMIFSDIGTPKTGDVVGDLMDFLQEDAIYVLNDEEFKMVFGEEDAKKPTITEVKKKLKDIIGHSDETINEIIETSKAQSTGKFNLYAEIKRQLVEKGIPADQIVFIHDYNTQVKRLKLFNDINDGIVRVVLGSTGKLGTGVNAQYRIIAGHHLDAPWRPSDMDQRDGRYIRQGNVMAKLENGNEVTVYQYATKMSLDALKYQYLDLKKKFETQLRLGTLGSRRFTDNGDSFGYAEMAAAISGNPALLEKAKLDKKVQDLERRKRQFNQDKYDALSNIRNQEGRIERMMAAKQNIGKDAATVEANKKVDKDGNRIYDIQLFNVKHDKASAAGDAFLKVWTSLKNPTGNQVKVIGQIYGLPIVLSSNPISHNVTINGEISYDVKISMDATSMGLAFERAINFEYRLSTLDEEIKKAKASIEVAKETNNAQWPLDNELAEAKQRLAEVNQELNDLANAANNATPENTDDFPEENASDLGNVNEPSAQIIKAPSKNYGPIPYTIIPTGDSLPMEAESTDHIWIERQLRDYNQIDFTGTAKITSANDVAWLMRSLEEESIEHFFAVMINDKGEQFVQHISTGGITGTTVDIRLIAGNAYKFGAKKIYIVHNHPSGNLRPSKEDYKITNQFREVFDDIDIVSLIMDKTSGYYAEIHDKKFQTKLRPTSGEEMPVTVKQFGKEKIDTTHELIDVKSVADIAAFIQSRRFGNVNKAEVIILNRGLTITAKLSIPFTINEKNKSDIQKFILKAVSLYGGTSAVLYGNRKADATILQDIKKKLKIAGVTLHDYLHIKSNKNFSSYVSEKILSESYALYKAADTDIEGEVRDGTTRSEAIINAFTNLAFLELRNGKTLNDFIGYVQSKHPYGNTPEQIMVLKESYDNAKAIYDTLNAGTPEQIKSVIDSLTFAPLINNVRTYNFERRQSSDPGIITFSQAITDAKTKEQFYGNVTPVYEIPGLFGNRTFATSKILSDAYGHRMMKNVSSLNEDADKATLELMDLTGDSPVRASFKLARAEYDNDTAKKVDALLNRINAVDEAEADANSDKSRFVDYTKPLVYDAVNQPVTDTDIQQLKNQATSAGYDAIIIRNALDNNSGSGQYPTDYVMILNDENIHTPEEIENRFGDQDFLRDFTLKSSDRVNQLLSGKTILDVFGEAPEGGQDYKVIELSNMLADGEAMIGAAMSKFGPDILQYAPIFLDYLKTVKWEDKAKKSVAIATLINKLNEAKLKTDSFDESRRIAIDKNLQRTYAYWQQFIRDASITLNAARLMRVFRNGNLAEYFTDAILEESQRKQRESVYKAEAEAKIPDEIQQRGSEKTKEDAKAAIEKLSKKEKAKQNKKEVSKDEYKRRAEEKLREINSKNSLAQKIIDSLNKNIC